MIVSSVSGILTVNGSSEVGKCTLEDKTRCKKSTICLIGLSPHALIELEDERGTRIESI